MKRQRVIFIFLIAAIFTLSGSGQQVSVKKSTSATQIIKTIIDKTGSSLIPNTVDIVKDGDASADVTGIVTCMFATMDVLKDAVEKNCNLIIAHEPLYYNHLDDTKQLQNDEVYKEKHQYILDHKLVVWRFHDYIHSMKPDGIYSGMIKKLGWEKNIVNGDYSRFRLPETTLNELLAYLKTIFPENAFYVVGNPDMKLANVKLAAGAPGSNVHIKMLEDNGTDVVLAGESPQWETYEYMRDAVDQGKKKAIIFLGHINSEESGMDFCAEWLKGFIKGIPVFYVRSGPSYWSY